MRIVHDIDLTLKDEEEITQLLFDAFKAYDYPMRSYYKQRPHIRCLFEKKGELVGYVGLDYRVMNIDGVVNRVLGLVDLVVKKTERQQGIGGEILDQVTAYSKERNVDLLILFADDPTLYRKKGFISVQGRCTLLMIDEHRTLGVKTDEYPELMIKPILNVKLDHAVFDLLGYLY